MTRSAAVIDAAHARRRARSLWPAAEDLVFTRAALEQASHHEVARARAWRIAAATTGRVLDLCAGIGGDALACAAAGLRVTAVERDPARAVLLRHNAAVRSLDIDVLVGDALRPPRGRWGAVHADPSRRVDGRRVRRLDAYVPAVPELLAALPQADAVGITVSPAVALDDPSLPAPAELEFLQVGPDLAEATIWTGTLRRGDRAATLLPDGHHRIATGDPPRLPVRATGEWLLEFVAAAVRARLHAALGAEVGAGRIAERRALLTCDEAPAPSPWWTAWRVEAVLPLRPGKVRRWLRRAHELPLEIAAHGVGDAAEGWWRELGRPPRGPQGRRLHLVRLDDGARCIVTRSG